MSEVEKLEPVEPDVDDRAFEEDEETSSEIPYDIASYGADYPVDGLVKRIDQGDIEIPPFQRGYVWTQRHASKFIESLLLGLPVPAIFLSKESDSGKLLVIDGQQRLRSLQFFYKGVIKDQAFRLNGDTKLYSGKTYETLSDEDRRRLDDSILHAIIVRQENPQDNNSSIFLLFERLNTSSLALSQQEIRACVYRGEFIEYLKKANQNFEWRNIFGIKSPRQKDMELLLRFFALYFDGKNYQSPMKQFLNNFMDKNRHLKVYSSTELNSVFEPTISLLNKTLGPRAFRPERALNTAVTDALLVGTAMRLQQGELQNHEAFVHAINDVLTDESFKRLYLEGTTRKDMISNRIQRVFSAIESIS